MKKTMLFSCISVLFIAAASCSKENSSCSLVPAQIIRYDCDRVIFKLLQTEMIGDANWEDIQTGQQYSNVVSYYNTCKIAELTNGRLDTLYLELKKTNQHLMAQNCMQCQATSPNPPLTKVDIISISKESCPTDDNGRN